MAPASRHAQLRSASRRTRNSRCMAICALPLSTRRKENLKYHGYIVWLAGRRSGLYSDPIQAAEGNTLKQVVAGLDGVDVVDAPSPGMDKGSVLIATAYSLISSGTERSVLANRGGPLVLAKRALTDPALRAKASQRIRSQGVGASFDEARRRAAKEQALGYSAAG